ncbi:hypothetical protein ACFLXA_01525 [Chloroflexota bacterium]
MEAVKKGGDIKKLLVLLLATVLILGTVVGVIACNNTDNGDNNGKEADNNTWSDGTINIGLDKIERTDVTPSEFVGAGFPSYTSDGYDYLCIYITITHIENVHLTDPIGYEDDVSALSTSEYNDYECKLSQWTGLQYTDPHDITSPYELVDGGTGILIFEIMENEVPVTLTYVYSFKVTWDDTSPSQGQVEINL